MRNIIQIQSNSGEKNNIEITSKMAKTVHHKNQTTRARSCAHGINGTKGGNDGMKYEVLSHAKKKRIRV